eukprot:10411392-Alexandrium_andersonii.AAC.1
MQIKRRATRRYNRGHVVSDSNMFASQTSSSALPNTALKPRTCQFRLQHYRQAAHALTGNEYML